MVFKPRTRGQITDDAYRRARSAGGNLQRSCVQYGQALSYDHIDRQQKRDVKYSPSIDVGFQERSLCGSGVKYEQIRVSVAGSLSPRSLFLVSFVPTSGSSASYYRYHPYLQLLGFIPALLITVCRGQRGQMPHLETTLFISHARLCIFAVL